MRMSVLVIATLLTVATVSPTPLSAQSTPESPHAAAPSAIDAALQQHVASAGADREAVRRVLERSEVEAVAGRLGIDLRDAKSAVSTMSDAQLTEVAAQAQAVDRALSGGASTIVISSTTIIIALLVLILIVVAVD